ncbi:MAG: ATP-dependent zinc metalloprotease FtsH [Thermoguttaceae bacterium]
MPNLNSTPPTMPTPSESQNQTSDGSQIVNDSTASPIDDACVADDKTLFAARPALPPPEDDKGKQKTPSTRKPPSDGFPLWMIVLAIVGGFLLLSQLLAQRGVSIPMSDFLRLVDQGAKNPDAFIEVTEGTPPATKLVRYSDLAKLKINAYEVSGTVTRKVLTPPPKSQKVPEEERDVRFVTGRQGLSIDNGELQRRLEAAKFTFEAEGTPGFWRDFGPTILMLLITVPILFILFARLGGAGAIAFGRNRGREVAQEEVGITFEDVAGVDEAVDELKEIVEFLKTPEKFQRLGGRIPRGVLLVGPPGTGKTILAKAVAGEANVPFFSLSGSDFVELYVGVGAARVRDLFDQANRRGSSIIFIDELDALGKSRSAQTTSGASEEREQTLNALLVAMDGFDTQAATIVLAATNRPETLDAALLRPGRFDRQVLVDRPDLAGREAILKVHLRKIKIDPAINIRDIASITSGFVGADLAALVNEAALLAARAEREHVTMIEFNEAVERVMAGLQKKQRVIRPDEKKRIAIHECGHAVVAYFLPKADKVHKVSIIPRGLSALGYTLQRPEDDRYLVTQEELETEIMILLGGTIAEEQRFGNFSSGASNDIERATEIARRMVMDYGMSRLGRINFRESRHTFLGEAMPFASRSHSEKTACDIDVEIKSILASLFERTQQLLRDKNDDLLRLAKRLLKKEVIENSELERVLGRRKKASLSGESAHK